MCVQFSAVDPSFKRFLDYDRYELSPIFVSEGNEIYKVSIPSDQRLNQALSVFQNDMTAIDQLNLLYETAETTERSDDYSKQNTVFLLESKEGDCIGLLSVTREFFDNPDYPKHLKPGYTISLEDIYILKEHRGNLLTSYFQEVIKEIAEEDAKFLSAQYSESKKELIAQFAAECVSEAGGAVATEMMYSIDTILCAEQRRSVEDGNPFIYIGMEDSTGL
ncbi:hypothetical protein [Vibrio harveyi]|uniref:hypothetical protein n=1 Tax=Vibrio harveyi TaxID=669 RepID=UPI003CF32ED6